MDAALPFLERRPPRPPRPPPTEVGADSETDEEDLESDMDSGRGSWAAAVSTPEMIPEHASELEEKPTTNWVPAGYPQAITCVGGGAETDARGTQTRCSMLKYNCYPESRSASIC